MKTKKIVYLVTYKDDQHRTHMTFVEGFSAVRFLEERFTDVYFELADHYPTCEQNCSDLIILTMTRRYSPLF